jgi:cysteine-rich repeat protein
MKNFKFLIILSLFLAFFWGSTAEADLASTKSFYLDRIDSKFYPSLAGSFYGRIEDMEYISYQAINSLLDSFDLYAVDLTSLRSQVDASSSEQEILDLMNTTGSSLDLTFMVLGDSSLAYIQANGLASQIQNAYQLINDTKAFVANYTTSPEYSLFENKRKLVFNWPNLSSFISPALAALETGWTCRRYDRTDGETCTSHLNLKGDPCHWDEEFGYCVGDDGLGMEMAVNGDGKEELCINEFCVPNGLENCYQNGKCAANDFLEEYVDGETGWTCRKYDLTDEETCASHLNLLGNHCFWTGKECVGDDGLGVDMLNADGNEELCINEFCTPNELKNCYQNEKCAANGAFEEYVKPPEDPGTCGDANGMVFSYDATGYSPYAQCATGSSTNTNFPVQGGTENWFCQTSGGDSPQCSASRETEPEPVGACGDAHEVVFSYEATGYAPYEQCEVGDPSKTDFPEPGATQTWVCSAAGGDSPECSASREENPETAVCGDGVTEGDEECDDGNEVDGSAGDFCYNNCTKKYLDAGDTSDLDNSLALLDTYEADSEESLDTNVAEIDALLVDIYNVYGTEGLAENEKLALLKTYQQSLDNLQASTQNLVNGVVIEVENILSL